MRLVVHAAIVVAFALWLVATTVKQFRTPWALRVQRHDWFSVVPQWTFFAPNPGRSDLHVLFRDRLSDGSLSAWTELDVATARPLRSSVWNPEKRRRKAVHDAIASLASLRPADVGPEIMVTRAYLMLLGMVCSAEGASNAAFRQFVVVATDRTDAGAPPKVRLKSALHPLV
jgi:hypothetical protein